jgi:hypothetical protein
MPVVGFSSAGLVLCLRLPRNLLGWLFLGVGFDLGLGLACDAYSIRALGLPGGLAAAVVAQLLEPLPLVLLPAVLLLFPAGRLPSARWRPVAMAWAAATIAVALTIVVSEPLSTYGTVSRHNPLALSGIADTTIGVAGALGFFGVIFPVTIAAAVSLVLRFPRATGDVRQQLKWFGLAGAFLACSLVSGPLGLWSVWGGNAWVVVWAIALTAVAIATGIAILRYRLYEIDVIIRRTLVYSALVGSLAAVYLAAVYSIDRGLQAVTGQCDAAAPPRESLASAASLGRYKLVNLRLFSASGARFGCRRAERTRPCRGHGGCCSGRSPSASSSGAATHGDARRSGPACARAWSAYGVVSRLRGSGARDAK